jgi:RNA polymerase sigma-70 factor, ECF subfamily
VLAVVYLIFNEGYAASSGERLIREELASEAIRLGRLLSELMPDEPEVLGLLALMLLVHSRRAARTIAGGDLVPLPEQDRSLWDRVLIDEGQALLRRCLRRNEPGPYQLSGRDQRRPQRRAHGGRHRLETDPCAVRPAPHVHPDRGRGAPPGGGGGRDRRPGEGARADRRATLDDYYLYHAIRADLLRRLGRLEDAAAAYQAAIERAGNATEIRFLRSRIARLDTGSAPD